MSLAEVQTNTVVELDHRATYPAPRVLILGPAGVPGVICSVESVVEGGTGACFFTRHDIARVLLAIAGGADQAVDLIDEVAEEPPAPEGGGF